MSDHQSLTKTLTLPQLVEVPSTLLTVIKIVGVYKVNRNTVTGFLHFHGVEDGGTTDWLTDLMG